VAGAGWWYLHRDAGGAAAKPRGPKGAAAVKVATVGKADYATDLEAVGTVKAYESIEVSPNVTEVITALHFKDGEFVKKGQLLASLSDAEEQAQIASAKATLAEEEREIARLRDLVKDGAAPEARLEERKTLADIARQKILESEARLADRKILAPFEGWVGLRRISAGALVSPGTVITTLDKIDVVKIDFAVPETALVSLKPGAEITVWTVAAKDGKRSGKISMLDSRIDPVTRSVAARAEAPNPDSALKPGMLVIVHVPMEARVSLSIPERALVPVGTRAYVFTVEGETAKRVEVKTGRRKPGFVEILSGLAEGQKIIADGIVGLQDGAPVKVSGEFKAPVEAFNPEAAK
jgi:membrane fusion protein (multidrug efflux system)